VPFGAAFLGMERQPKAAKGIGVRQRKAAKGTGRGKAEIRQSFNAEVAEERGGTQRPEGGGQRSVRKKRGLVCSGLLWFAPVYPGFGTTSTGVNQSKPDPERVSTGANRTAIQGGTRSAEQVQVNLKFQFEPNCRNCNLAQLGAIKCN
jgi:hypothetical protein